MKQTLITIGIACLLFFCSNQVSAQYQKLAQYDSLIAIAETDSARIHIIGFKLDVLSTVNLDSAIHLAQKTLKVADSIGFYPGQVNLNMSLINNYSYKGNFKAAYRQIREMQQIIRPGNDSADYATFYSSVGLFYGIRSKYDSSILYYEQSVRIYERNGTVDRLGTGYSNIAIGYQQQSNFPMALEYQQKALKLYEELGNKESGIAYTLVNMANTYSNLGDNERAESTFLKTIELAKKLQLNNVELYAYSNLANMYADEEKWQDSYESAMKSVTLGKKLGDPGIESAGLSKASNALVNLMQSEKAIELSKKAIALADSSEQPLNINTAYTGMGYALIAQKKWQEAIPYYERAFEAISDADIYTLHISKVYRQMSECYENTGKFDKALELYKKSVTINDSVTRKENIRKATEQTMNFEFEKKMLTARAAQDAKDEIMYTRQIALIVGLLLSFIIIALVLFGYFGKRRANVKLLSQKTEIEHTLARLRNTQSQLIHAEKMASLGELTAGIAHEIQNPLNFVNNFSEVNAELIQELNEELEKGKLEEVKAIVVDLAENESKISHHGKRADAIVKGMLQHSRASSGIKEPTDINALADEYLRLSYHGLRAKDKSFNADFKTEFEAVLPKIEVIPQDIGRVLLNLINNAFYACTERSRSAVHDKTLTGFETLSEFEHGGSYNPTVTVTTKNLGDKIEIRVKDNGTGIPENIKAKIFQPFFTTKPTGQGTGLGLSLSYDIVKAHGGEIKVNSKAGDGTEFKIILPAR
ncbi:MAG: tetratricopeptide repeat protein [Bacteroidales bacterium]|nr:tetratricopeptide repeat protein [Bacteroidales bacterium]